MVSMPPAARDGVPRGVVEQRDRVPEHVAVGGADEQGALTDPDGRGDADPEQAGLLLAQVGRVVAGEVRGGRAALPVPADVLALVVADRAVRGGSAVSGYCTAQVAQIQAGTPDPDLRFDGRRTDTSAELLADHVDQAVLGADGERDRYVPDRERLARLQCGGVDPDDGVASLLVT